MFPKAKPKLKPYEEDVVFLLTYPLYSFARTGTKQGGLRL